MPTIKPIGVRSATGLKGLWASGDSLSTDITFADPVDDSKEVAIDASGITPSTTRTITVPDADLDLGSVVMGPGSATDHAIARFDLTTGVLLQDSGVLVDDSDNLFIPSGSGLRVNGSNGPFEAVHISDGNFYMEGSGEVGLMVKRIDDNVGTSGPLGDRTNPIFITQRISQAGDGDFESKILFNADEESERVVFKYDSKGIFATVAVDGILGRSIEGYKQDGDVNPFYAISSEGSESRLELGPGAGTDVDVAITRTGVQELSLQVGPDSTSLASKLTVYADSIVIQSGVGLLVNGLPAEYMLSQTTGIDGTVSDTTNLYTVPSGKSCVITKAIIRCSAADTISAVGTAGIGIAAGEDDIFTSTELLGLTATTVGFLFTNSFGLFTLGTATDIIKLGIDTGFTAVTATLEVDLFGYLL